MPRNSAGTFSRHGLFRVTTAASTRSRASKTGPTSPAATPPKSANGGGNSPTRCRASLPVPRTTSSFSTSTSKPTPAARSPVPVSIPSRSSAGGAGPRPRPCTRARAGCTPISVPPNLKSATAPDAMGSAPMSTSAAGMVRSCCPRRLRTIRGIQCLISTPSRCCRRRIGSTIASSKRPRPDPLPAIARDLIPPPSWPKRVTVSALPSTARSTTLTASKPSRSPALLGSG